MEFINGCIEQSSYWFYIFIGVIPLGGARDAKQAEQNAGALGWRLTNEEIKELESHHVTPNLSLFNRIWQHGWECDIVGDQMVHVW
jgi:diketogulonate reductase-like aldo/keto reductase